MESNVWSVAVFGNAEADLYELTPAYNRAMKPHMDHLARNGVKIFDPSCLYDVS